MFLTTMLNNLKATSHITNMSRIIPYALQLLVKLIVFKNVNFTLHTMTVYQGTYTIFQ